MVLYEAEVRVSQLYAHVYIRAKFLVCHVDPRKVIIIIIHKKPNRCLFVNVHRKALICQYLLVVNVSLFFLHKDEDRVSAAGNEYQRTGQPPDIMRVIKLLGGVQVEKFDAENTRISKHLLHEV